MMIMILGSFYFSFLMLFCWVLVIFHIVCYMTVGFLLMDEKVVFDNFQLLNVEKLYILIFMDLVLRFLRTLKAPCFDL